MSALHVHVLLCVRDVIVIEQRVHLTDEGPEALVCGVDLALEGLVLGLHLSDLGLENVHFIFKVLHVKALLGATVLLL